MLAKLIDLSDKPSLTQIYNQLITSTKFSQNPHFDSYFQKITKQQNYTQPVFAIGYDPAQPQTIKLIYTLHTQYKLTRQLCKCVHIEEIFKGNDVSASKIEEFHRDLLPKLDCYKVVGLGMQENGILKPNQKLMTVQNKPML